MARLLQLFSRIPKKLIKYSFITLIVLFLALYLKNTDWQKLTELSFNWWWLIGGSVIAVAYRYIAVYIWRVILRALGAERLPPFRLMASVFAKAWMARYIPGTITWIAGRIYMASSYGISKSRLAVASLLEGGIQVVTGIVIALPLLGLGSHSKDISPNIKVLAVILSLGCLVALLPPVFNKLLHIAHVVVRRQKPGDELRVNGRAVWQSFLLFSAANFITGFANYMVARAIDPSLDFGLVWYLIGTFSLAGALGIATPFLPSGIGVRDGVQLVLLNLVMPKEMALAITLLSRIWGLAVDVIFFSIAAGHHKAKPVED